MNIIVKWLGLMPKAPDDGGCYVAKGSEWVPIGAAEKTELIEDLQKSFK